MKSLGFLRQVGASTLVPAHTSPLAGRDLVDECLAAHRNAVKFVHDQTVRLMNKGMYPDAIVDEVALPAHLASHPTLQEFHGTVEWASRAVFDHYMGWFSGDPVELHPLAPKDRWTSSNS